jgi:hypothetical protein
MGSIFTVLIALGLMQPAASNIEDRRKQDSRYIGNGWGPAPLPDEYAEEKKQLVLHGFVLLHSGTPLSRALGEDDIIRSKP